MRVGYLRSVLVAVVAAAAIVVTPSAAVAAAVERAVRCSPGPSGNACVRLYTDAGEIWAVGATDPYTGHHIRLDWVALYIDYDLDGVYNLYGYKSGVDSWSYQRIASPHAVLVCPRDYMAKMQYLVDGSRSYQLSAVWQLRSC